MNVRFAAGALRCRVTRAELDLLLSGRAIGLEVSLPREHVFRMSVRPTALNEWRLDSDPTGLWLTVARTDLEQLSQSLPTREGLERSFDVANGAELKISFEVDVRDQRR